MECNYNYRCRDSWSDLFCCRPGNPYCNSAWLTLKRAHQLQKATLDVNEPAGLAFD